LVRYCFMNDPTETYSKSCHSFLNGSYMYLMYKYGQTL
jgi:hypothetical protein